MPIEPVDDLIGHLYDAAVDSQRWSGMAVRIAEAFDSTSAVVKFHRPDGAVELMEATDNMRVAGSQQELAEVWHRRDLWVTRSVAHGLDRIVTDEELVTPEEQRRSGFYREFLPLFDIFHVVGSTFSIADGAIGVFGVHRAAPAGAYQASDRHKAARFLPHLQRAVRLGTKLSTAQLAEAGALDALDRLDTGLLVLDRHGRIVHANATAETLIRDSRDFGTKNRAFHLVDHQLQARFTQLLRDALALAAGQPSPRPGTTLTIARHGRLPVTLSMFPLRPGWSRKEDPGPAALLFLKDPEHPALPPQRLSELFGLTRTEAAIAADLGGGKSLEAIAAAHGIGLGTVRWHLKHILAKTGTTRQAEAVVLLVRSIAALG
jgi:DNA-binding CsgD family transcriptional regulator/PAS domain-containing protein